MLIGRNVLKLMSTVIGFHHLPLLMVVEVSPQPLPFSLQAMQRVAAAASKIFASPMSQLL